MRSARNSCGLLAVGMLAACMLGESGWGNAAVMAKLSAVTPQDIATATVDLDRCPREPQPFPAGELPELLSRLAKLTPVPTIGYREQWEDWRPLKIDAGRKGHFEIKISTRPSLNGKPVAIIEEGTDVVRHGFYAADEFWPWFKAIPEVAALETTPSKLQPCS